MLKNIHIEGFRGISDLEIQDFKQINILLGKNNCGKTSVLEGIYILKNGDMSQSIASMNTLREIPDRDINFTKTFFYGLTTNAKSISISGLFERYSDKINAHLSIEPIRNGDSTLHLKLNLTKNDDILLANFSTTLGQKKGKLVFNDQTLGLDFADIATSDAAGFTFLDFSNPNAYFVDTKHEIRDYFFHSFSLLFIEKKHTSFINTLQKVDASIQSISIVGDSIYFDTGLASLIPIQIAGDGIKKILSVLVAMASSENGIVLIDEIENGLHYSSMKTLWRAIIEAAKQYKVQLFITTHNAETLKYLAQVLEETEYKDFQQEVNSYTLRRLPDGRIKAFNYTAEALERFSEGHFEIR